MTNLLSRVYGDWATKGMADKYLIVAFDALEPLLRVVVALALVWFIGGSSG